MFAFTKEQLATQVAKILEGTPLLFEVTRSRTCLLMVGVDLPIGFRMVDKALYDEHKVYRNFPILGEFRPDQYTHTLVVKTDKAYGFPGYTFEFSPWADDPHFKLDHELKKIEALADIFRIPI